MAACGVKIAAELFDVERNLRDRVRMVHDNDVEASYPQRWIGKVDVATRDGRVLSARVEQPRGDPGNTLSRNEIEDKAVRLAEWSGAATGVEVRALAQRIYALGVAPKLGMLLTPPATAQEAA